VARSSPWSVHSSTRRGRSGASWWRTRWADLKRYTRARRTVPALAPFPAEWGLATIPGTPAAQSEAVFQALAQFLHDSLAAERVTLAGAMRIVLSLLADLFAIAHAINMPTRSRRSRSGLTGSTRAAGTDHGLPPPQDQGG